MKLVFALLLQGWIACALQHSSSSNSSNSFLDTKPGAIFLAAYERLTGSQPMPTVNHDKEPGNGYIPGSPLYDKQEALKSDNGGTAPKPESVPGQECQNNPWLGWCLLTKYPKSSLVNLVVQIVLFLLVAYLYKAYKTWIFQPNKTFERPLGGWAYHLFSCHDCRPDISICCMAFCCPGIRWADTLSNDKVMKDTYWQAIATLLILQILAPYTSGITLLIMLGLFIYIRQRIRGVFGHSRTCFTICTDCLTWWCCSCCAIVQEAREVEKVKAPAGIATSAVPPQMTFGPSSRDGLPSSMATMPPTAGGTGHYPTLPPQSGLQPFGSSQASVAK